MFVVEKLRNYKMVYEIIKNLSWTDILIAILSTASISICLKKYIKQTQKSGDHSKNLQANGDIIIKGNIDD